MSAIVDDVSKLLADRARAQRKALIDLIHRSVGGETVKAAAVLSSCEAAEVTPDGFDRILNQVRKCAALAPVANDLSRATESFKAAEAALHEVRLEEEAERVRIEERLVNASRIANAARYAAEASRDAGRELAQIETALANFVETGPI